MYVMTPVAHMSTSRPYPVWIKLKKKKMRNSVSFGIYQQSDDIAGVKDRYWAHNQITLEFDWIIQDCVQ